jgi:methionyl-tRNA formyltransferase
LQEKIAIGENETAGTLHDKMKELGAQVLVKTIRGVAGGTVTGRPQSKAQEIKQAPKIFTETCKINWNKPVDEVYNLIRGLSPFPGAFTLLNNNILKIYAAGKEAGPTRTAAGQWETDGKGFLKFAAADGYIHINELQLEGKKKMNVADFLRGFRFE